TAAQETGFVYRVAALGPNGRSSWAAADEVETPAVLVIHDARVKRPGGKKPKPVTLTASGEFDVGTATFDLSRQAILRIEDQGIDIAGFVLKGRRLRFDQDGVRLDLLRAKGDSSRVAFRLQAKGDVVAALEGDGELALSIEWPDYTAVGMVELSGDRFRAGKLGRLSDPRAFISSLRAALKPGARDVLKIKAVFDASSGAPETAPDVEIGLGTFTFTAKSDQFTRRGDKWIFTQRVLGTRRVSLDFRAGKVSISLQAVELGEFAQGAMPVGVSIAFGDLLVEDAPVMKSTGKSLRY
ncbi:MAG: hypothetical protein ACYTF9_16545, partial [Planctomycetota bacterium]